MVQVIVRRSIIIGHHGYLQVSLILRLARVLLKCVFYVLVKMKMPGISLEAERRSYHRKTAVSVFL